MKKEEKVENKKEKVEKKSKDVKKNNLKVERKSVKDTSKKEKEQKYKVVENEKLKKIEFVVSSIVGIIFLVLLVFSVNNEIFIPATLISFALFLFCICYYYIDNEKKKTMVYVLFGLGVFLIVIEVIYTLVKIS